MKFKKLVAACFESLPVNNLSFSLWLCGMCNTRPECAGHLKLAYKNSLLLIFGSVGLAVCIGVSVVCQVSKIEAAYTTSCYALYMHATLPGQ